MAGSLSNVDTIGVSLEKWEWVKFTLPQRDAGLVKVKTFQLNNEYLVKSIVKICLVLSNIVFLLLSLKVYGDLRDV